MWHHLLFYGLLFASCGYAFARGGAPERWAAAVVVAGTIATYAVAILPSGTRANHFRTVETGIFAVDVAMLFALLAIALAADRFWPLWMTSLQAFGVVGHVAKWLAPDIIPDVYNITVALMSYPVLLILLAATHWRHQRMKEVGADNSWSTFSNPLTWSRAGDGLSG